MAALSPLGFRKVSRLGSEGGTKNDEGEKNQNNARFVLDRSRELITACAAGYRLGEFYIRLLKLKAISISIWMISSLYILGARLHPSTAQTCCYVF